MQIPYCDNPGGSLTVTVDLQHTSDVFLVDQANYDAYQRGNQFQYVGGNYDRTPAVITVSGAGRWYLIVNNDTSESYQYRWS